MGVGLLVAGRHCTFAISRHLSNAKLWQLVQVVSRHVPVIAERIVATTDQLLPQCCLSLRLSVAVWAQVIEQHLWNDMERIAVNVHR